MGAHALITCTHPAAASARSSTRGGRAIGPGAVRVRLLVLASSAGASAPPDQPRFALRSRRRTPAARRPRRRRQRRWPGGGGAGLEQDEHRVEIGAELGVARLRRRAGRHRAAAAGAVHPIAAAVGRLQLHLFELHLLQLAPLRARGGGVALGDLRLPRRPPQLPASSAARARARPPPSSPPSARAPPIQSPRARAAGAAAVGGRRGEHRGGAAVGDVARRREY